MYKLLLNIPNVNCEEITDNKFQPLYILSDPKVESFGIKILSKSPKMAMHLHG